MRPLATITLFCAAIVAASGATAAVPPVVTAISPPAEPRACTDPPEYYAIDLVATRNLPGLGRAGGKGLLTFASSAFGISITERGHYSYELTVAAERLPSREDGEYVAWITTPNLDDIRRIGPLDDALRATTMVELNKFLVVVTFEPHDAEGASWKGPIILRGMSRSGLMHTMAGHGPFSSEPCAKYGY